MSILMNAHYEQLRASLYMCVSEVNYVEGEEGYI